MKRRSFIKNTAMFSTIAILPNSTKATNDDTQSKEIYELRQYQLTGGGAKKKMATYITKAVIPLLNSNGIRVGAFEEYSLEDPPKIYTLFVYPTINSWMEAQNEFTSNKEYINNANAYLKSDSSKPLYTRYETSILEAFDGIPKFKKPNKNRGLFELRTYESYNEDAGNRKIKMFNIEELPLFENVGLHPVFFGKMLAGKLMPALTYMLWFENMEEREANWNLFKTSDEWNIMKAKTEYANTVSKVNKTFLLPLDYSQI